VIDGENGGDDSGDPTCGGEVKDLDVDEAHGKNEGAYSKGGVQCCMLKRTVCNFER